MSNFLATIAIIAGISHILVGLIIDNPNAKIMNITGLIYILLAMSNYFEYTVAFYITVGLMAVGGIYATVHAKKTGYKLYVPIILVGIDLVGVSGFIVYWILTRA